MSYTPIQTTEVAGYARTKLPQRLLPSILKRFCVQEVAGFSLQPISSGEGFVWGQPAPRKEVKGVLEMQLRSNLARAYMKEKALRRVLRKQAIIWAILTGVAFFVGIVIGG